MQLYHGLDFAVGFVELASSTLMLNLYQNMRSFRLLYKRHYENKVVDISGGISPMVNFNEVRLHQSG